MNSGKGVRININVEIFQYPHEKQNPTGITPNPQPSKYDLHLVLVCDTNRNSRRKQQSFNGKIIKCGISMSGSQDGTLWKLASNCPLKKNKSNKSKPHSLVPLVYCVTRLL